MSTEVKQKKQKKNVAFTAKHDIALLTATLAHGVTNRGSSQVWETIAEELKEKDIVVASKKFLATRYQTLLHAYDGMADAEEGEANRAVLEDNCSEPGEEKKKKELLASISENRVKTPKKAKEPKEPKETKEAKEAKEAKTSAVAPSEPFEAAESPVVAPKTPKSKKSKAPVEDAPSTAVSGAEDSDDEGEKKTDGSAKKKPYRTQKVRRAEQEALLQAARAQAREDTIKELFEASALEVPAGSEMEAWKFMREAAAMKVRLDKQLENEIVIEKLKLEHAKDALDRAREFEKWKFEQSLAVEEKKVASEAARDELLVKLVNHVIELKKK